MPDTDTPTTTDATPRIWQQGSTWVANDPDRPGMLITAPSRGQLERDLGIVETAQARADREREAKIAGLRDRLAEQVATLEDDTPKLVELVEAERVAWTALGDAVRAWDDVHAAYLAWADLRNRTRSTWQRVSFARGLVREMTDELNHHRIERPPIVSEPLPPSRRRWSGPSLRFLDAMAAAVDETAPPAPHDGDIAGV